MTATQASISDTTRAVLEHHLAAFRAEDDALGEIMRDYAEGAVLMTPKQTIAGLEAIEAFYAAFLERLPASAWRTWELTRTNIEGEVALITWKAPPFVKFASDTLIVREGRIVCQTMVSVLR